MLLPSSISRWPASDVLGEKFEDLDSCLIDFGRKYDIFIEGFRVRIRSKQFAWHEHARCSQDIVTGVNFLLGYLAGLEIGPPVGNAPHGSHMLTMRWHSGATFGGRRRRFGLKNDWLERWRH